MLFIRSLIFVIALLPGLASAEAIPRGGPNDSRVRLATYQEGQVYRLSVSLTHVTTIEFGETLALHIERHGGALPGQQVRNDEARGLATARGRHDERMRKNLGANVIGAGARRPQLAEDEPGPGRPEEAIGLHLARTLPMGLAKACQGGPREGEAQHQPGGGEAADDQVNKLGVLRAAIEDRQIVLRDIGKVDLGPEAEILVGQHRRGDGIAHGPGHQRYQQDPCCDPRFSHGGAQWT